MKLKERLQAVRLRKKGYSMREISQRLGVAKSSVSLWVRDIPLSKDVEKILCDKFTNGQLASQKAHRRKTEKKLVIAQKQGTRVVSEATPFSKAQLAVMCALLYWCEGTKSKNDSSFRFTNSDPNLVASFLYLFRKSFNLDEKKFRVCVHLHDYHDEKRQLQFWSKLTNIPLCRFRRPYHKPHTGKQVREGYEGCVSVRYYDVNLSRQVQAIARAFLNEHTGP